MAAFVNGKDFLLYINLDGEYRAVACLTDCAFSTYAEPIRITSRSTGVWAVYDYTFLQWSGNASGLFLNVPGTGTAGPWDWTSQQLNRLKPVIRFVLVDGNGDIKEVDGSVIIEEVSYQGGAEDFASFNITMRGTGPLTITSTAGGAGEFVVDSNGDFIVDSNGDLLINS